jgi:hypothetical protein
MNPAPVLSHACDTHRRDAVGGVWSVLIVCCDRPLRRQEVTPGHSRALRWRPSFVREDPLLLIRNTGLQAGGHRFDPGWLHSSDRLEVLTTQ